MRIDLRSTYDPAPIDKAQTTASKTGTTGVRMTDPSDQATDVRLSGLEREASSAPEIREDRVHQLRQAIASGTYSVTDEQLAEAMIRDALRR